MITTIFLIEGSSEAERFFFLERYYFPALSLTRKCKEYKAGLSKCKKAASLIRKPHVEEAKR